MTLQGRPGDADQEGGLLELHRLLDGKGSAMFAASSLCSALGATARSDSVGWVLEHRLGVPIARLPNKETFGVSDLASLALKLASAVPAPRATDATVRRLEALILLLVALIPRQFRVSARYETIFDRGGEPSIWRVVGEWWLEGAENVRFRFFLPVFDGDGKRHPGFERALEQLVRDVVGDPTETAKKALAASTAADDAFACLSAALGEEP